jgi:hypothetical protein
MKNNLLKWAMIALLMPFGSLWSQTSAKFEDISLAPNSFYNGSDFAGGFKSGDYTFTNEYDSSFGGFWSGFAVSNTKNDSTPGFLNQYSSITGGGRYSQNYGVFYGSGKIKVEGAAIGNFTPGFYITNSTYAYFDMKNGSAFTKKFGGASGNDPDYFAVEISAWKNGGNAADTTIMVYLADFRDSNNSNDYILNTWKYIKLTSLGIVDSFSFDFHSSDTGDFGINTPMYFCLDQFGDMYTGLKKLADRTEISIYPNPAREQIQLSVNGHFFGYEILDMSGKKLMVGNENTIDISTLPTGIYLIQLQVGDAVLHQKFIKE